MCFVILTAGWWSILLLQTVILAETSGFDYCKISNIHTMCVYKTISKNCVQYKAQSEVVVRRILNDHNMARSKFAGGQKGYFVPNMMKLYWDQELADLSARWACQCKGSLDADRGVRRFEVGQIVWTVMHPHNFTRWNDIWKYIIGGGTGFYQRDSWGRMITNYNPADPLSLIYNPYVRFIGCTLAKYLIWSIEVTSFAYTTTLVCNYGPIEESYEKYPKEDWPCRDCPHGKPCFTKFYMRGNVMPPNLQRERNLCIDPQLEYQHPRPGKRCPVDLQDAARELHTNAYDEDKHSITLNDKDTRKVNISHELKLGFGGIRVHENTKKKSETTELDPPPWAVTYPITVSSQPDNSTNYYDYDETPHANATTSNSSHHSTPNTQSTPNTPSTVPSKPPSSTPANMTEDSRPGNVSTHQSEYGDDSSTQPAYPAIDNGGHDPSEEEYDYHGPIDSDGHVNYCELSCVVHIKHTLCLYHEISPECGQFTSLTNAMTEEDLLNLHNEFRNDYTDGTTSPLHPLASNMVRLQWSKQLRNTADMWLRQCKLEQDGCRDDILKHPGNGKIQIFKVSQNIGWKYYNLNETCPSHRELFNQWKAQAHNFTFTGVSEFLSYKEDERVSGFVQLIWARTHYVGCAYGSFTTRNSTTTGIAMLVCNYAPLGKEVGKHIYIPGGPCSACFTETFFRRGHCYMTKYPNLCDTAVTPRLPSTVFVIYLLVTWSHHTT